MLFVLHLVFSGRGFPYMTLLLWPWPRTQSVVVDPHEVVLFFQSFLNARVSDIIHKVSRSDGGRTNQRAGPGTERRTHGLEFNCSQYHVDYYQNTASMPTFGLGEGHVLKKQTTSAT